VDGTGQTFSPAFVDGASPVCRFYLLPADGDSHFFGVGSRMYRRCMRFPTFVLEDREAMYMKLPDVSTPARQLDPVYRLWNGRRDTSTAIRSIKRRNGRCYPQVVAEGYGPDSVCVRP
jgi:hypothetical protein